ncbi:unnamed protein product [Symbiodinium necroappetens]|uniref:Uncharacterized protein n=1 Tax=Symbiodinium necroappetens TaxID=1628268 RepID=A0A813BKZ5_9DINO|nr:unnamed protein product [Symbiodinium necroappetens]
MFCFWMRSDDDILAEPDINDEQGEGEIPHGTWRFKSQELVRAHVQPGRFVQWVYDAEDVEKGELGQVVFGEGINDQRKVKAKGSWGCKLNHLFANELQMGSFVVWLNC